MAGTFGTESYNQLVNTNAAFTESQKTFSAFTGADIVAYMGHKRIATLQGITYSITREIMPVFVMGDPNPKAFAKGKRAIAGNLVFTQFDKHAILKASALLGFGAPNYIGNLANFNVPDATKLGNSGVSFNANLGNAGSVFTNGSTAGQGANIIGNDDTFFNAVSQELAETYALVASRKVRYSDQVPPFDITITMVNELGQSAYMALHSVQLVNEGGGYTLDDLNSEAAFTFVARAVTPLDSLTGEGGQYLSNTNSYSPS